MNISEPLVVESAAVPELEKELLVPEETPPSNAEAAQENIIVTWDGPSDPANPYNWPATRKWFTTLLTSLGGLVTLMTGPMLAPALDAIGKDLYITREEASMALSIYILAFAFGPMILAPIDDPRVNVLIPVGLLVYGWAVEKHLHWIVPDIGENNISEVLLLKYDERLTVWLGIGIFGCGYLLSVTAVQTYVVEAYLDYTASGAAASQLPRNVFAFAFPIFAPGLFSSLGYGYGNTLLAGLAIVLGIPAPYVMWKYGETLRKNGKTIKH